jgi:hypothetical protein
VSAAAFRFAEALSVGLPCRVIHGELGPYISRFTLRESPDGGHIYLHFFHRGDADRDLHNHPWPGRSFVLAGGYWEERLRSDGSIARHKFLPGETNILEPDTFHRVDLIEPERGCWTLFSTGPKAQSWGFRDRDTGVFTPWREALQRRGLVPVEKGGAP